MGLPMFLKKKFPNVMPPQRRIRALLGICIVILFAVIHFIFVFREQTGRDSHVYSGRKHSSLRTKNIKNETRKKTFIIWTGVFGEKKMDVLIDCPLKDQCRQVYDRNLVSTVDAVLIHLPDINASDVPAKKYMGQKYVLFMMEVPTNLRYHIQRFPENLQLDWVMSYRYDSDIPMVYGGWWVNQSEAERTGISPVMLPFDRQTILKEKLNAVFWFVSNCETQSKRELAVKKLSRFIPVDIFGKCSRNKADLNVCPEIGSDDCMRVLSQKYYFFIALENTVCKDYITEKYWNRYTFPSVPIVMRRKTYENHLPTNSFIAMDDFKSSKEMAAYLGFLMQNEERYMEYFGWRSKGWARPKWQSEGYRLGYCRLCEELMKEVPLASRSTREIFDWFINTSECEKDEFARNWE